MGDILNKFAARGFVALQTLCLTLGLISQARADSTGYAALGDSYANEYQSYTPLNGINQQIPNSPIFSVAGASVDRIAPSEQYNHLLPADGTPIDTVGQGLLPRTFADSAHTNSSAGSTPLSTAEIIQAAKQTAPAAVPLPPTWQMGLVGLLLVSIFSVKSVRRIFI